MGKSNSKRLERYSKEIDRLQTAARSRASLTAQVYSGLMVVEQVALRSVELAQASFYVEKAAIAAWLEEGSDVDSDLRAKGLEFLAMGREELVAWGRAQLATIVSSLIAGGDMRSSEEISFEVCGISTVLGRRGKATVSKHAAVSHHDIDRLMHELICQDPLYNFLERLRKTKIENSHTLSAILLHTCWLTGMRPVEMFRCALVIIKDDDVALAPNDIDKVIPDITDRSSSGLHGLTAIGSVILDLEKQLGGSIMLAIRNAKTVNANQETVQEFRILNLSGIDPYRLGVLWLATQLRRLAVTAQDVISLRDLASRHARVASKRVMPDRDHVTLYTMRHDFSDRAKRRFPKAEVAALMGHTGKNSAAHYGTKSLQHRGRGGRDIGKKSSKGWMPQPDQEQASRLLAKWRPDLNAGPEISMEIEDFEPAQIIATPSVPDPVPEIQSSQTELPATSEELPTPDNSPDF